MEPLNVKAGDTVALLLLDRSQASKDFVYKPNRLERIAKVTAKQIYIGTSYRFDLYGLAANRMAGGKKLSTDPAIIAELQEKADARKRAQEEKERADKERNERPSYQLACQIAHPWAPGADAVEDLELLGEDYLRQIVADIAKAKKAKEAK